MLQGLLRQRKLIVKDSKLWQEICHDINIGQVRGKDIHFTHKDLNTLETYGDGLFGYSILELNLDAMDRMDSSEHTSEDKWSKGGVFEVMLPMARSHLLPLPVKGDSNFITPPGVVVSLQLNMIDTTKIDSILIIENGTLMTHWDELVPLLPSEFQHSLIIYRGHGQNQNMLVSLINSLPKDTPVGVFYDFDAAGYDMALKLAEIRTISILHPSDWGEFHKLPKKLLKKLNKKESFIDQIDQLMTRINSLETPNSIKEMLVYIRDHRFAITQEHLIKHQFPISKTENIRIIK